MRRKRYRDEALVTEIAGLLRAARFHVTSEIRTGDAKDEILACAAVCHPDLIVVGSHVGRGFQRLALGSVSEGVMRRAVCSVEIVRDPA